MDIRATEEFKSGTYLVVTCPICGNETLDSHWICDVCHWEYDGAVAEDEYSSANQSSVAEYRNRFQKL